ncbi:MAG: SPOR domain-containing protein [Bacteroidota bacterium]|nr:SPOR domain-containing protein [Bacteroidota bacterium]
MKNITLFFALVFFFATLFSCNAKQEKSTETEDDTESIMNYEEYDTENDTNEIIEEDSVENKAVTTDTLTVEKEAKKEPVMEEKEDGTLKKVEDREIEKAEEEQKKATKKVHVKKFYVIAGSFQEISNAVDLRAYFKTKGYPAMVLYPYQGYNRVAVKSFSTRNGAETEIRKVRQMHLSYKDEAINYWLLWR